MLVYQRVDEIDEINHDMEPSGQLQTCMSDRQFWDFLRQPWAASQGFAAIPS